MDPFAEPNEVGLAPMTCSATDDGLEPILRAKLPAVFDIEIGRRAGRDGKPASFITSAKLLRPVPVDGLLGLGK